MMIATHATLPLSEVERVLERERRPPPRSCDCKLHMRWPTGFCAACRCHARDHRYTGDETEPAECLRDGCRCARYEAEMERCGRPGP